MWREAVAKRFEALKDKYDYDEKLADSKIEFIENRCVHIEGDLAEQKFKLEDWQKDEIIRPIFGLVKDGKRLIREAYIQIPRKNGKTSIAAPIQLLLLLTDGEGGAQIINAAGDDGQANLLYRITRAMADRMDIKDLATYQSLITYKDRFIKRLTSKASTKHGLNLHGGIIDEIHVLQSRELYDVLRTSTGQRSQPLIVSITTPGTDKNSVCYQLYERTKNILTGRVEDDQFWGVIYESDKEADIYSPKTWAEANPLYESSPYLQNYIAREAERAREDVSYENTFRQLHLGQWVASEVKWIKDEVVQRQMKDFYIESFKDNEVFLGLDFASVMDITALTVLSNTEPYRSITYYWIPSDKATEYEKKYNIPYTLWSRDGWINIVDGNITDFENDVMPKIEEIFNLCSIRSMGYDPSYGAMQMALKVNQEYGFDCNKISQGYRLHPGLDRLKGLLLSGGIELDSNPITRWMFDNSLIKRGNDGKIMVVRTDDEKKIDGIVSNAMAIIEGGYDRDEVYSKIEVW